MKIQNYWSKMMVLSIYLSLVLALCANGYAQGLGPSKEIKGTVLFS